MYNGKKILAIIPARGGSKGIPMKNVYPLCGTPLMAYTIKAAKRCSYIDKIIVSTDSEEIAATAKAYDAEVPFLRPEHLAKDDSKTIHCVLDVIQRLKEQYDVLILLQPTSPLRDTDDINEAIRTYFNQQEKGLVSLSEVSEHPLLMRQIEDDKLVPLKQENSTVRRQDMKPYYMVNGAIYINAVEMLSEQTSFNDNTAYYMMEKSHSVDVDSYKDLALCEYYLGG